MMDVPFINVVKDLIGSCLTVRINKILIDPGNEMILKCALNELM
jgi:hypothetical protein